MIYLIYGIALFFILCYSYQLIYIIVGLVKKPVCFEESVPHKFAVIISARNEETVIANLLNSIRGQTYPAELVDTYVIADNCTDETARISRECGAKVYERFDDKKIGKGYALDFLFNKLFDELGEDYYDGFFVFDADNLLEPDYIEEMNKTFTAGYRVITSYRNSKNYGTNWISAGYALWFLREARYLNNSRMILNSSCAISGTGFLLHKDMIKKTHGWKYFLLTEDIEFTVANIIQGEKIGYCHKAMLYDEQPESFVPSWNQRLRWSKGFLQVFAKYGGRLMKSIFKKHTLSCYDLTMTIWPAMILSLVTFALYLTLIITGIVNADPKLSTYLLIAWQGAYNSYLILFVMGLITVITEWNYINCSPAKKILYLFTFPLFIFTYIPIAFVALFKKVEWKPIKHNVNTNIEEITKKNTAQAEQENREDSTRNKSADRTQNS